MYWNRKSRIYFDVAIVVLACLSFQPPISALPDAGCFLSKQATSQKPENKSTTSAEQAKHADSDAIKGVVISQSKDKTLKLQTTDGKTIFIKITGETKCKLAGSKPETDCTILEGTVIKVTPHGTANPVDMHDGALSAVTVQLQSTCREEFCPKTKCKHKCGATKCVCSS